jgi:hypothetical protein
MNDQEIKEALYAAVYSIFDVSQELKRRGWDNYDARKLMGSVETYRDELLAALKKESEPKAYPLKGDFCPNCGPVDLARHFACDYQLDAWEEAGRR